MCNLSDGIEQRGIEQGHLLERIEMARDLKIPEDVLIEQLMEKFQLTREKVLEYIEMSDCSEQL